MTIQRKSKSSHEPETSDMPLAKTYISHTSFINQIELSHDEQYLFVSGAFDDCVVKYRIQSESEEHDLDSLCYPLRAEDPHD